MVLDVEWDSFLKVNEMDAPSVPFEVWQRNPSEKCSHFWYYGSVMNAMTADGGLWPAHKVSK